MAKLLRSPKILTGLCLSGVFGILAIIGPLIAPYNPNTSVSTTNGTPMPPSAAHSNSTRASPASLGMPDPVASITPSSTMAEVLPLSAALRKAATASAASERLAKPSGCFSMKLTIRPPPRG